MLVYYAGTLYLAGSDVQDLGRFLDAQTANWRFASIPAPREVGDLPRHRCALAIIQMTPMQVSIENKRKGIDCLG